MPGPVELHLQPSPQELAQLQGSYTGPIRDETPFESHVRYTLLTPIEIHGSANIDGKDEPASLIGFELFSSPESHRRRITQIIVSLQFFYSAQDTVNALHPQIIDIEPESPPLLINCTREEHQIKEDIRYNVEIHGGNVGGADIGGKANAEKARTDESKRVLEFAATVNGYRSRLMGRKMSMTDCVTWIANEQPEKRGFDGVPPDIRCMLLLIRPWTELDFLCRIKVDAKVDWHYDMKEWWSSIRNWGRSTTTTFKITDSRAEGLTIDKTNLQTYQGEELRNLVKIQMSQLYDSYERGPAPESGAE